MTEVSATAAGTERVPEPISLADIEAAADALREVVRHTPVEFSRPLTEQVGAPVWLKCENLQRTGSFKIRGAYLRIARLSDAERAKGVVAASAGNHAQGVALAASLLGAAATLFMPYGAPIPKVEATKGYGAAVQFAGVTVDDALRAATENAHTTGAVFIHPFDHHDIICGQGTVGLEILEQVPDVETIVVSAGGGGLIAGIAVAVRALRPEVRIVGVQAAGAASFDGSFRAGRPVPLESMSTMADGIAVGCPGALTFPIVERLVDEIVTVTEDALARALLLCLERSKLTVEPAGAAAVAAVMEAPDRFTGTTVALVSGGNIDPVLLMRVLRHGMVAAGRYLSFHVRIPDRPGELSRLLAELAVSGANVLDVEHLRTGTSLHLHEVEVALQLETRGADHSNAVLDRLRAAGYALSVD